MTWRIVTLLISKLPIQNNTNNNSLFQLERHFDWLIVYENGILEQEGAEVKQMSNMFDVVAMAENILDPHFVSVESQLSVQFSSDLTSQEMGFKAMLTPGKKTNCYSFLCLFLLFFAAL